MFTPRGKGKIMSKNIYRCQVTLIGFAQIDIESDEVLSYEQIKAQAEAQAQTENGYHPEVECDDIEAVKGEVGV